MEVGAYRGNEPIVQCDLLKLRNNLKYIFRSDTNIIFHYISTNTRMTPEHKREE